MGSTRTLLNLATSLEANGISGEEIQSAIKSEAKKQGKEKPLNFKQLSIEAEDLGLAQCRSICQLRFYRGCHSLSQS